MSFCKACGKPIDWYTVAASGKRMPLDRDPSPDGNVRVNVVTNTVAVVPVGTHAPLYLAHFSTRPKADEMRKRR